MQENDNVAAFFSAMGQKRAEVQQMMDDASAEGSSFETTEIGAAGTYVARVKAFVYKKKGEEAAKCFPRLEVSSNKGVLQLLAVMEVVEGTDVVPVGATTFFSLTLQQPTTADADKHKKTIGFMKPAFIALTGVGEKDIQVTPEYFQEYLTIDFNPETKEITRMHKMLNNVRLVVEESWDETKKAFVYRGRQILKYTKGDKSISVKSDAKKSDDLNLATGSTANMSNYVADKTISPAAEKPSLKPDAEVMEL